jgi:Protein of unknown function with PCYCGC motif
MKKNWLLFGAVAILAAAALLIVNSARTDKPNAAAKQTPTPAHNHEHPQNAPKKVPAFQIAPTRASLGPTLEPDRFTGLTRDAYRAVKQIPLTIAQLPCYCHCDEGFGHKSLYSCFEDDHAAHCATCVNEALLALSLQRDQKLTPEQIRERIVQQYSNQ